MDSFLQFLIVHNQAIINWLFVLVLVLSALVALLSLARGEEAYETTGGGARSAKDLEVALRKVMDEKLPGVQAPTVAAAPVAAVSGDDAGSSEIARTLQVDLEAQKLEVAKLQAALAEKENSIKELQQSSGSAAPSAPSGGSGNDGALKAKIEELEAKLAEYSIIEDDIADLCLFKEENLRLKEELERLKTGAPPPMIGQAAATPVAEPAPEPALVTEAPIVEAPVAEAAPVEPMAEPLAAVSAPAPDLIIPEAPAQMITPEEISAQVEGRPTVAQSEPAPDNVIEFPFKGSAVETPDPLAAELDTDKVLAEMASLTDLPNPDENIDTILDSSGDPEKMASEAASMGTATEISKGS